MSELMCECRHAVVARRCRADLLALEQVDPCSIPADGIFAVSMTYDHIRAAELPPTTSCALQLRTGMHGRPGDLLQFFIVVI